MSYVIHMETEQVENQGISLSRAATDISNEADELQYCARALSNTWVGSNANSVIAQLKGLARQLQVKANEMDELGYRVRKEVEELVQADSVPESLRSWIINRNWESSDALIAGAGLYAISTLHGIASMPNSIPIHGPNDLTKFVFGKNIRVINPATLNVEMAKLRLLGNLNDAKDVAEADMIKYAGSSRMMPAAITDGLVKGAIGAAGTGALFGIGALAVSQTAIIGAAGAAGLAALGIAASPVVVGTVLVGGIVLATWTIGSVLMKRLGEEPLWDAWKKSQLRDRVIEGITRGADQMKNFVSYQVQTAAQNVKNAFNGFIHSLAAPATA